MDGTFFMHQSPRRSGARTFENMPRGRVWLCGAPRVGECLVIVAEGDGAVVQTSPVTGFLTVPRGVVVETVNSLYTFTETTVGSSTVPRAA